jgi:glycosyltransferase involved in cell wall biosynthesis
MKIAMMVRGYIPAPRPKDIIYAPIDLAVALSEGLSKRGHSVDFYGPLGTKLNHGVKVVTANLRPLVHNNQEASKLFHDISLTTHYIPQLWDELLAIEMFKKAKAGEYDVLHFHHGEIAFPQATLNPEVPVVYTQHDPFYPWRREAYELYHSSNQHFVTISNNQRRDAPDMPYASTVYNGVDVGQFPFGDDPEDYLLMAGRIVPEKGFKEAVQLAKQTGDRLLIIGPVYPESQDYFDQYIKPHLNDKILYLGYVEYSQMWRYYQKAKALLTPVQWEEPFGLTSIEAMACGTPVISLRRGAAPEIIADGKTGFIVDSIAEMAAAVGKISQINRGDCREHVKKYFSIGGMVTGYEATYKKVLQEHKKQHAAHRARNLFAKKLKEVALPKLKAALPTKDHTQAQTEFGFQDLVQEITQAAQTKTERET